uniref:ribonuclease H n=1 Tax=Eptatretus burgeri TaxID=7764 RepID=A0A8C4Q9V3_EPTBU
MWCQSSRSFAVYLFALRDAVSQEVKTLEEAGIIERIDSSEWVSPIIVTYKITGGTRLCVNPHEPNKVIVIDSHPLPHIEEVFTELQGMRMFSTLDLQSAYHQVPLHEESRDLTVFITYKGLFHYCHVPYGLPSAPRTFQRMMSQILAGQESVQYYPDNIIVYASSPEKYVECLQAVLNRLDQAGLKLHDDKCHFRKAELSFLGHVISEKGMSPNTKHVVAVTQAPPKRCICSAFFSGFDFVVLQIHSKLCHSH